MVDVNYLASSYTYTVEHDMEKIVLVVSVRISCAVHAFKQAHSKAVMVCQTVYSYDGVTYKFVAPFKQNIEGVNPLRIEVHNRYLIHQDMLDYIDDYNKKFGRTNDGV